MKPDEKQATPSPIPPRPSVRVPLSLRPARLPPPRPDYREAPRKGSGQHPAVRAYRAKLQSISDHQGLGLDALDPELEAVLDRDKAAKTDPPEPEGGKP
jgi:hypothetical protein